MLLIASILIGVSVGTLCFAVLASTIALPRMLKGEEVIEAVRDSEPYWSDTSWKTLLPLVKQASFAYRPYEDSAWGKKIRSRLAATGNPLHLSVSDFFGVSHWSGIAFAVAGLLVALVGFQLFGLPAISLPMCVVFSCLLGIVVPYSMISSDATRRVRLVDRELPYALDLMILMIDAGATIQEALQAVTREGTFGPLGEEFTLVDRETQHGTVLTDALLDMAERIPSEDLIMVVTAIAQGLKLGTPISSILREQSDLIRLKRSQNAEKLAKEAGSKMTFPIILITAATFLLIIGPAVLQLGSMTGQQ